MKAATRLTQGLSDGVELRDEDAAVGVVVALDGAGLGDGEAAARELQGGGLLELARLLLEPLVALCLLSRTNQLGIEMSLEKRNTFLIFFPVTKQPFLLTLVKLFLSMLTSAPT